MPIVHVVSLILSAIVIVFVAYVTILYIHNKYPRW